MALLSFSKLSKSYGLQVCFEQITEGLNEGEKVGLIGANGTGKSTLVRILAGLDEPDEGVVSRKKDLRLAYMQQDPALNPALNLREAALEVFAPLRLAEQRMHDLHQKLAEPGLSPEQLEEYLHEADQIQHELTERDYYHAEQRAEATLLGLGFEREELTKPVKGLSGGERSRLGLTQVLLSQPELMILDEPTNHLDIAGVTWLESFLRDDYRGAALVISHDRYFLDQVAERIFEIEGGKLYTYRGNYTKSRELKAERLERQIKEYEQQQQFIQKQLDFIRRYRAGQRAKEARGRLTRLERFMEQDAVERPVVLDTTMKLALTTNRHVGSLVCEIRGLSFQYPGHPPLFDNVNFDLRPGEVLGIVGPNGAGKTTLLNCVMGKIQPTRGTVKFGGSIKSGYLSQREEFPDGNETIVEHIHNLARTRTEKQIRDLLGALLFRGDEADKPLHVLSGGEKKRVAFARLLLSDSNVLFLDEPTNHLDLPSREALEDALEGFPGSIVLVTHDRYLLDRLADRILWLSPESGATRPGRTESGETTGPEHRVFLGNYTEMKSQLERERQERLEALKAKETVRQAAEKPAVTTAKPSVAPKSKGKPPKKYKGSLLDLEQRLDEVKARMDAIVDEMSDDKVYSNPGRVAQLNAEYESLKAEQDALEEEWLERAE